MERPHNKMTRENMGRFWENGRVAGWPDQRTALGGPTQRLPGGQRLCLQTRRALRREGMGEEESKELCCDLGRSAPRAVYEGALRSTSKVRAAALVRPARRTCRRQEPQDARHALTSMHVEAWSPAPASHSVSPRWASPFPRRSVSWSVARAVGSEGLLSRVAALTHPLISSRRRRVLGVCLSAWAFHAQGRSSSLWGRWWRAAAGSASL